SWTNRLIEAKDHSSIQINVGKIDPNTGLFVNEYDVFAMSGFIRRKGEGDHALTELVKQKDAQA
ncbi:unnamed protein product, partial [Heterosigma akashiwo]